MDVALITGADNIIGQSIGRKLIALGYRVYAFSDKNQSLGFAHKDFILKQVDLANMEALEAAINEILDAGQGIHTLVHAAEASNSDMLDESPESLIKKVHTLLLAPVLLTKLAMPALIRQRGQIIHLCWPSEDPAMVACTSGLKDFSATLFKKARNTGIKVTTLGLWQNNTEQARTVNPYDSPKSIINPELVADAVERLIRYGEGNVITHMEIHPQATEELKDLPKPEPRINEYSNIQLPPKENIPEREALIPTPQPKKSPKRKTVDQESAKSTNRKQKQTRPKKDPSSEKKLPKESSRKEKSSPKAVEPEPETKPEIKPVTQNSSRRSSLRNRYKKKSASAQSQHKYDHFE